MSIFPYNADKLTAEEVDFFEAVAADAEIAWMEIKREQERKKGLLGKRNKETEIDFDVGRPSNQTFRTAFYGDLRHIITLLNNRIKVVRGREFIEGDSEFPRDDVGREKYRRSEPCMVLELSDKFNNFLDSGANQATITESPAATIRAKINEFVKDSTTDDVAKIGFREFIDAHFDEYFTFITTIKQMSLIDTLSQWAQGGAFNHKIPFFSDESSRESFARIFVEGCQSLNIYNISGAIRMFMGRLEGYEAPIRERIHLTQLATVMDTLALELEAKEIAHRAQQREEAVLRERILAEQIRRDNFLKTKQPYVVSEDAQRVWNEISHVSSSTAQKAKNAELLLSIIESALNILDIRDDNIKELGHMLFSAANLCALTEAFEVPNSVRIMNSAKSGGASKLRTLHISSSAVREVVERLLDSDGIVLLAMQTCGKERYKKYTSLLISANSKLTKINDQIHKYEVDIAGFEPEEQILLKQEVEYTTLLTKRDTQRAEIGVDTARVNLASEIGQVFRGISRKRIVTADMPAVVVDEQDSVTLSPAWIKILGNDFKAMPSPEDKKLVRIVSNEFLHMHFDIKPGARDENLSKKLVDLNTRCGHARFNEELMGELCGQLGFHVVFSGTETTLQHTVYDIDPVEFVSDEIQLSCTLIQAKENFDERRLEQKAILETAQQLGMKIECARTITISHSNFDSLVLGQDGYLTADGFTAIKNLVSHLHDDVALPDVVPLEDDVDSVVVTTTIPWEPEPGTTLLTFDTVTLNRLAAKRDDNGHSWLDLVKCTARLPNVVVVIPAIVAEWELQGKILIRDGNGRRTGFEQIDERFQSSSHALGKQAEIVGRLFRSASRADLKNDGTVSFEPGSNQNIIVMDTEGDEVLYSRIRAIVQDTRLDEAEKITKFRNEIHGNGEGEEAINRIVNSLPFRMPVMIISDDRRYFENSKTPRTTGQGMPVGQAGTINYLDAEIRYREPVLRRMLRDITEPIFLYRTANAIRAYHRAIRPGSSISLSPHSRRGKYAHENDDEKPQDIYELIRIGCNQAERRSAVKLVCG